MLEVWTVRLVSLALLVGFFLCLVSFVFQYIPSGITSLAGILSGDFSLAVLLHFVARGSRVAASTAWRRVAVLIASYVAGPLLVLGAFLLVAFVAAQRGIDWPLGPSLWALLAAAYLLVVSITDDEVSGPLHMLYRERLSTAFIRFRTGRRTRIVTEEPPWEDAVNFAGMDLTGMPSLVVCASVNVADDVVPPGRFAGPFTFEGTFSGGPLTGYLPTASLQDIAGDGVLTLPAMMAIAGAAFSPLMGRTTRPGWRVLLALFDVRLGVWLPNPRCCAGYLTASELRRGTGSASIGSTRPGSTRFSKSKPPPRLRRPGWSYALREALGLNSVRLPYVYVTDGGHWENLGLVWNFCAVAVRASCASMPARTGRNRSPP